MWFELKEFPRNFTFIAAIGTVILLLSLWLLLVHRKLSGSQDQYETLKGAGESKATSRFYENRPLAIAFVLFIISTYIMPFAMILIGSLQKQWAGLRFQFVDWSLEGYRLLLVGRWSDIFYESVINAMLLGAAAGLLTLILSVMVSYLSIKTEWRGGSFLNYLSYSPIAIPALVIASALQWIILEYNDLFGFLYASLYILVIVFSANFMLYSVRAVNSSLRSVGSNLGEIGSILGASRTTIVREIYAPLMKPGLLAGFIIIFIETTKTLSIPLILGGNEFKIVQNTIWRFTSQGETNLAAAYSVLLVVALGVVYAIAYKFDVDLTSI